MNNILNITDWNNYIYNEKIKLIINMDKSNILDTSIDSLKFNDILKDIIKLNIFNISYIAFMTFKFLETSFIPSEIILNVLNLCSNDNMYYLLLRNRKLIIMNDKTYKIDKYKYIQNLKFIIKCIIDFVIKIEVSLNIQCLLITDFINKIDRKNNYNYNHNYNDENSSNHIHNTNTKPMIFTLFNKNHRDIILNIKPSTSILLFLKLISKLSITNYDTEHIINFLKENQNTNTSIYTNENNETNKHNKNNYYTTFMNKKKVINKKTKMYLDEFMLDITNYFFIDTNKNLSNRLLSSSHPDIYMICSKYILNNIELIFHNFENIFSILEYQLLKSININENKKIKLVHLRNVINNIVAIQIDNIKKYFYI